MKKKVYGMLLIILMLVILIVLTSCDNDDEYESSSNKKEKNQISKIEDIEDDDISKDLLESVEENDINEDKSKNEVEKYANEFLEEFNKNVSKDNKDKIEESESNNTISYDGYEVKGIIGIDKTRINYPILDRVTVDSLSKSVAILSIISNSGIDQVEELNVIGTNALILGHNYKNGTFFSNNNKLFIRDKIKIKDSSGKIVEYTNIFSLSPFKKM